MFPSEVAAADDGEDEGDAEGTGGVGREPDGDETGTGPVFPDFSGVDDWGDLLGEIVDLVGLSGPGVCGGGRFLGGAMVGRLVWRSATDHKD